MADEDTSLVGREEELSRLRGLVASPYTESRVLLLLGKKRSGPSSQDRSDQKHRACALPSLP